MRGVNKVIIVGNLGADPETRQFNDGGCVSNISVATSEQWTDKQTGEKKEATEWHRISLFNRLGEIASQYLRKGSKVYIEGSLRTRKYQDSNGQDRYITEIRAESMQMLDSAGNNSNSQNQGGGQQGDNNANYNRGNNNQGQNNNQNQGQGFNNQGQNNNQNQGFNNQGQNNNQNQGQGFNNQGQNNNQNQGFNNQGQNNQGQNNNQNQGFNNQNQGFNNQNQGQPQSNQKSQAQSGVNPSSANNGPVDDDIPF